MLAKMIEDRVYLGLIISESKSIMILVTIMAEGNRYGAVAIAESLYLDPQAPGIETNMEMAWTFETPNPIPSNTPLP